MEENKPEMDVWVDFSQPNQTHHVAVSWPNPI